MPVEKTIPLFPLGLVLLPQILLPLHIFEERYKMMIGECLKQNKQFGIVYYNGTDIQTAGCTAGILRILKRYDDGRLDILTCGEDRFVIKDMYDRKPYLEARVNFFDDEEEKNEDACQVLADKGMNLLKQFTSISGAQDSYSFDEIHDFKSVSFLIAGCDGFSKDEKQRFLEMSSTRERLKKSIKSLEKIMDRIKITLEIRNIIGGNGNMTRFSATSYKLK